MTWILRACAIILSLTVFHSSWQGLVENRRFDAHGQRAVVDPIATYTETTTTGTKLGIKVSESTSHTAEIVFTTLDRQRIRVSRRLPDDVLAALIAGSAVYIEYLPEAPTTTRFVGHPSSPLWSALFGLLVVALTGFFWRKM